MKCCKSQLPKLSFSGELNDKAYEAGIAKYGQFVNILSKGNIANGMKSLLDCLVFSTHFE